MARTTTRSIADGLFAELRALKKRDPSSRAVGVVGRNGVTGEVSVFPTSDGRGITAFFSEGHMARMNRETAIKLTVHLRAGGPLPLSPASFQAWVA